MIYNKQFSSRSKQSTIDALVELLETLRIRRKFTTITRFLPYLKKGLHIISHKIGLQKLCRYASRWNSLSWFISYTSKEKPMR